MSDNGDEPRVIIDYNAIDEATGFKKAEITIWEAYEKNVLKVPEDDRPDPESWADEWADESNYDRKRVKAVTVLGIYAGRRDEFSQRLLAGQQVVSTTLDRIVQAVTAAVLVVVFAFGVRARSARDGVAPFWSRYRFRSLRR